MKVEIKAERCGKVWQSFIKLEDGKGWSLLHESETFQGCFLWVFSALDLPGSGTILLTVETGLDSALKVFDAS